MNVVHGDEKWFYLMKDGSVCRVFPQFSSCVNADDGRVVDPKVFHKSRMPKVMFLAGTARPRAEYAFDGKVGIWPFTVVRKAKRSDSRASSSLEQPKDDAVSRTAVRMTTEPPAWLI